MVRQRMNRKMREINTMMSLSLPTRYISRKVSALLVLLVPIMMSAATKGPDTGGYSATDATVYSFVDISGPGGGTSVLANVDDDTAALTMPFSFTFYGTSYTIICASSNGALYFVPNATACANVAVANDAFNTDLSVAGTPNDL